MWEWYGRLTGRSRPVQTVDDPVLGALRYDAVVAAWRGQLAEPPIHFLIAGCDVPSPALVAHARDIARAPAPFLEAIRSFLEREARALPSRSEEIVSLSLRPLEVCLFWPTRPDDGMLYFDVENGRVLWHSDYVKRKPVGLTCDT